MGVNPFANHFRPTDIQGDGGRGAREEMEGGMGGRGQGDKGGRENRQGISFTALLLVACDGFLSYYHTIIIFLFCCCRVNHPLSLSKD